MRLTSLLSVALLAVCTTAGAQEAPPAAQSAAPAPAPAVAQTTAAPAMYGEISGSVKAGTVPLPGVNVSATNTLTGQKLITSTDLSGNFSLQLPGKGRYVIRAELAAFAPATREALINDAARSARVDVAMELASRAQEAQQQQQGQLQQLANAMRGQGGSGFQNLSLAGSDGLGAPAGGEGGAMGGGGNGNPNGATPGLGEAAAAGIPQQALNGDSATESFSVSGNMGRSQDMGANFEEMRDRIMQEIQDRIRRGEFGPGAAGANIQFNAPGGFGGGGGGPQIVVMGGPGGGGGFNIGGRGGRFNINQPHGMLYYSLADSVFDARPYSLTGVPAPQPDYAQQRFGAMIGGPLNIPHIYKGGTSTFFTVGYNGSRASNPFDAFATVPTLAERAGNFSSTLVNGQPVTIINPATGQPFPGNKITSINPAALGLLNFIPQPNQPGTAQNFHFVSSSDNQVDSFNFRIVKNFGASPNQQRGQGQGQRGGGQRGGGGGRGAFNRPRNNINFGLNYNAVSTQSLNIFPSIVGHTKVRAMNVPFGWSHSIGRVNSNFRVNFNRNRVETTNLYAGVNNIAGSLGITGVATNPFDWGIPGLTFTHYTGLRDVTPALRRDQTLSFGETLSYVKGRHNLRWGGDYRRIQLNPRVDSNARGVFTFSGFASGYDFADFLLGLPQQTTEQFGTTGYYFRGNSWDLFAQDDWRLRGNLTLNLGLRYEYVSPFSEKFDRIVNLDATPGFTAVAPVTPNAVGPYTGKFPASLMNPDRNNFAPRVGIAWKVTPKTVVRSGYGISYNTGAYNSIVQQMAYQPPFATTATNIAATAGTLTLQNGFPTVAPGTLTNNFGADRNYALGYVQNWDLNIQRELTRTIILNIGYSGAKGTRLDMLQAPNRGASGLLLPGVQAFNFQTSVGDSILHSGDVRIRKRMAHGFSLGGTYTYSKSIDNASTIGGGATVVAQNAQDLAAERGLSSFDIRHRFVADYVYELPFGTNKRWLSRGGPVSHIFGDWQWSGNVSAQSGSPFTPRVLGAFTDIARGTNGTLRANVTGQPVQISDPTIEQWFNTAAFVAPPAGQFGNARRNSVIGPGMLDFDMSVSKNFAIRDTQGFEVRLSATNVFNHAHFTAIDTAVNSPTFGQVTSVGSMRKAQFFARYHF